MKFPAPSRLWALILAGPPLTVFAVWIVWIIWKGPWLPAQAQQQLEILGWGLIGALCLVGVVVVSLASVKVSIAGPGGFHADVDGNDDEPPAPIIETTTKTTTELKP